MALLLIMGALLVSSYSLGAVITVNDQGVLTKDGKPYRAIGVNMHDAFWRLTEGSSWLSYEEDFEMMEAEGLPFARIAATNYGAESIQQYIENKEAYLLRLDGVVQAAEKHGIGLVMDLFFYYAAVPDLVGEPGNQWGNPDSKTIAFIKEYTQTIVTRYLNSPAIWVWEFSAEYNLYIDLPNAADWRPPLVREEGYPKTRTKADDLTTPMMLVAFNEFAKTVREIDKVRPITSGNSSPRAFAESMRRTGWWTKLDSRADYRASLALQNPDPFNMLSVHMYHDWVSEDRFAKSYRTSYSEMLKLSQQVSMERKKPLFIGEWGAAIGQFGIANEKQVKSDFDAQLKAIVASGVPLAAVSNFTHSVGYRDDAWTISRTNYRAYMLDEIRAANVELAQQTERQDRIDTLLPVFEQQIEEQGKVRVRELQAMLKGQGFYKGSIDGAYGPASRAALTECIGAGQCSPENREVTTE